MKHEILFLSEILTPICIVNCICILYCSQRTKLEDDVYNFGFILLESLVGPIVTGKGEAFLLNEMVC